MRSSVFSVRQRHISLLWSCLDLVFHFKGYVSTESIFRWVISLLRYVENRQSKQGISFRSYYIREGGWGLNDKRKKNRVNVFKISTRQRSDTLDELKSKNQRTPISLIVIVACLKLNVWPYWIALTRRHLEQLVNITSREDYSCNWQTSL